MGYLRMNTSSQKRTPFELHRAFIEPLNDLVVSHSDLSRKPLSIDGTLPLPKRLRAYLFNVTSPPGGRTVGEHKVQLIVPGQSRGERGNFDRSENRLVILGGFCSEEGVFVLWDADLYYDFSWSRNVQVNAETVFRASAGRIVEQVRVLRPNPGSTARETIVACPASRLLEAIEMRVQIRRRRLIGDE